MRRLLALLVLLASSPRPCHAQEGVDDQDLRLRDRIHVSGEDSAFMSTQDAEREGWFNYLDYGHSTVRTVRLSLAGAFTITQRLVVLGEFRTTQFERPEAYAMASRRPSGRSPVVSTSPTTR